MFNSMWQDVKSEFRMGNMITRLIIINVIVFIIVNLVRLGITLTSGFEKPVPGEETTFDKFISWIALSNNWLDDLIHPWVFITSMFLHVGFIHILFNMLFLYWFGKIVGDLIGDRKILPLYLLGGLSGGIIYVLVSQYADIGNPAYGASAGVMAIVLASGFLAPDYILRLLFVGEVKLKYVVGILIFLDLVGIGSMDNTGGHLAHLGGAAMGWFFIFSLRNGKDIGEPINRFFDYIKEYFTGKKMTVAYKNPNKKSMFKNQKPGQDSDEINNHQEHLDAILDKIKRSGYESLTKEEKEFLFKASKK